MTAQNNDILIEATNVSKKFCRSLKRSLFYGATDIAQAVNPFRQSTAVEDEVEPALRKDEFWAVRDINFQLRRGECLGLLGHNGAGKSTLLKILNSLVRPDTGQLIMRGRICALIELGAGFNPILTGLENIYNSGSLLGIRKADIDEKLDDIIEFAEIGDFIGMPVQNYSSGMKVRLGFAVAMQMQPDILLLDEVLAVGDAAFRFKCLNAMSNILKNSAVIFVSHSMSQINRICNRVAVLDRGEIKYFGGDIPQALQLYFNKIDKPEIKTNSNGDLEVKNARVYKNDEQKDADNHASLKCRDTITFDIEFLAKRDIKDTVVGLTFWNQELYPVASIADENGAQFVSSFTKGTTTRCVFEAKNIHLNADKYYVSLHVYKDASNYLQVDNIFVVNFIGEKLGNTSYLAPSHMTIHTNPET